jgi:hypothetical protein
MAPILTGAMMAVKWPEPSENFYASIAQIIATLFVAMMIEFFASEATQRESFDATLVVMLLALSWVGLLACIYALAGASNGLTVGLAGAGVTSASVLVSLTLYDKVKGRSSDVQTDDLVAAFTVILFLVAPVLLLILL